MVQNSKIVEDLNQGMATPQRRGVCPSMHSVSNQKNSFRML